MVALQSQHTTDAHIEILGIFSNTMIKNMQQKCKLSKFMPSHALKILRNRRARRLINNR